MGEGSDEYKSRFEDEFVEAPDSVKNGTQFVVRDHQGIDQTFEAFCVKPGPPPTIVLTHIYDPSPPQPQPKVFASDTEQLRKKRIQNELNRPIGGKKLK